MKSTYGRANILQERFGFSALVPKETTRARWSWPVESLFSENANSHEPNSNLVRGFPPILAKATTPTRDTGGDVAWPADLRGIHYRKRLRLSAEKCDNPFDWRLTCVLFFSRLSSGSSR